MALGADAVLLGRPYAYALAVGGQRGVEELIQNLMAEIDLNLALAGGRSIRDLDRSWLTHRGVVLGARGQRRARGDPASRRPRPGEVLVRIEATGVCHSDLHVIEEDGWGHPYPILLGHEGAGTIEAVGDGVDGLAPGDRVVLGWKTACGACSDVPARRAAPVQATARGAGRLLRADGSVLTPVLRTGTFATHTVVPAVAAVKVPRELPVEQACLIGCAVATGVMSVLETAKVWEGARVAVIGCGAVGLSVIQGARIAGASEIRAIDLDERKLEQATRFGATHTEPGPVDFVFDVVGAPLDRSSRDSGCLSSGGTFVLIGLSPGGRDGAELDLPRLFAKRTRDPRLARRRPPAAGGLPAARAVGARRQARPRGDGHAHGAARGLERRARRDGARRRDPHGAHAVTLELLQRIVAGEIPGAPVARPDRHAHGRGGGRARDLRARRRAAAHEPARDAARRHPLRPRRRRDGLRLRLAARRRRDVRDASS